MEAWTDLANALNESSVYLSRPRSGSTNFKLGNNLISSNKQAKNKGLSRRRTKSTGNLRDNTRVSSSSEGEMDEYHENAQSSLQQTETDEGSIKEKMSQQTPSFVVPSPVITNIDNQTSFMMKETGIKVPGQTPNMAESDSVNEIVAPMRPHTRRKRRFKRMAVDPEPVVQNTLPATTTHSLLHHTQTIHKSFSFSTFASSSIFSKPRQKRVKKKPVSFQKVPSIVIGKRKRSVRERSIECELEKISLNSSPETEMMGKMASSGRAVLLSSGHADNDSMELDMKQLEQISSSSVSGSESDPGFYTYDDGREADDEQSDWYQESGPTWGVGKPWWEKEGVSSHFRLRTSVCEEDQHLEEDDEEDKLQQMFKGGWTSSAEEAKDAYKLRMQKLRDRIPGREIRAGRRHLGAQRGPSFSVLTSANEKLSRFLQDPAQTELRLHPMQKSERDQLSRLASLYSLQMLSEGARGLKCPVLKKTSNTMQAVRIDMDRSPSLWSDFKRQKKTPPASIASESTLEEQPHSDESYLITQVPETCIHESKSSSQTVFRPSGEDSNDNCREELIQMPQATISQ